MCWNEGLRETKPAYNRYPKNAAERSLPEAALEDGLRNNADFESRVTITDEAQFLTDLC